MSQTTRADARKNRDLLLAAAAELVAEHGTDASLRDIARRAGVGIGTLYRHFPTREALLETLLNANFDVLRARADSLLASPVPSDALLTWLGELAAGAATYQGLPESIMNALANEESGLHASCAGMRSAGGRLLERAQQAGSVRSDVTISEVIALALGLAWAAERSVDASDLVARMLSTTMYGLADRGQ
ncbi:MULTISPECIES: TetR/AcrR family transcriptional regulator [Streptomyces]|uniref:TetR/AcrR family transcriptional regulator n=1 Tax=Streptomyces dengpaensis TaxID=2049881 RepID=A0ABM6T346_9ACTN|nr:MULTISPECIES: TetR/AcrR family transcriptional regulator [Streptomyces]AVH61326.1 TetR/AcrR family transcriptional regulator [Streptomyces dengpaensis]PIB04898.1 TetR family transcriptional regulator [Streptomyces sp. HG99]